MLNFQTNVVEVLLGELVEHSLTCCSMQIVCVCVCVLWMWLFQRLDGMNGILGVNVPDITWTNETPQQTQDTVRSKSPEAVMVVRDMDGQVQVCWGMKKKIISCRRSERRTRQREREKREKKIRVLKISISAGFFSKPFYKTFDNYSRINVNDYVRRNSSNCLVILTMR